MDYSENFLTQDQIEKAIELSFSDIDGMLIRYVYFKGLVHGHEMETTYVDGYFIIESTHSVTYQCTRKDLDNDPNFNGYSREDLEELIEIKGSEFSNNNNLIDKVLPLKNSQEIDVVLYSYKQLCQLMAKLGCPEPKCLAELNKKEYFYDLKIVNQKSNFTLSDAARIAANIYSTSSIRPSVFISDPRYELYTHYLEVLADCIKGNNQYYFKLHTIELWCSYNDEFGDSYSKSYDNGTYLKQRATINSELTIISKREFVRWCEYENVDTGLYYHPKQFDESIEALEMKLYESEKEVSRLLKIVHDEPSQKLSKVGSYPPELQLVIDAFDQFCFSTDKPPTNEVIRTWLLEVSKDRGITHKDGSKVLKGLSFVKLKAISSIIKP
jgi:hypothetical protein